MKERIPHYVSNVDFDVAINIQDSQSKTGGANIEVFSVLNIGGKGEKGIINTSINRIKFSLGTSNRTRRQTFYNKVYSSKETRI